MRYTSILLLSLACICGAASARPILERYVTQGLQSNIVLQQKTISLEKAQLALRTASSLFLPTAEAEVAYTSGEGGRSIAIPVGTIINPVYQTLNLLTGSDAFPTIANVKEDFLPHNFYDARIRTSMPLLNTDIIMNRKIETEHVQLQECEVAAYKRELVMEIKIAYFNYLSARDAVEIYRSALSTAVEAKRVTESLVRNGAGLSVYVLRADTELESLKGHVLEAEGGVNSARMYFNFLLNRTLDSAIDTLDDAQWEDLIGRTDADSAGAREELGMLEHALVMSSANETMKRLAWMPKVSAFLDLGMQDKDWAMTGGSRYYQFGVQVSFPLFEGCRTAIAIDEATLSTRAVELEFEQTRQQVSMMQRIRTTELATARQHFASATAQVKAAEQYHRLIDKGYAQGVNSFIETIDARSQLTTARLSSAMKKYQVCQAQARYEREMASSTINY
ncbi:MAG TPA: TolC family protein [Bacteroidota bacterium]|nr:TolC family protein [Bacteroidota bacterium]